MSQAPLRIDLDLAIIGGGVAGLWLANRAQAMGYQVAVFEAKALGSDQTLASQGMIHGGMKYTLAGTLTGASEAIAEMPRHWRACLCGEGDIDLRDTRILSDHFFMWSSESLASRVTTFFASKITRGRVEPVSDDHRPPLLRNSAFSGSLYKLEDLVIDTPSLVANLAHNLQGRCFHLDWNQATLEKNSQGDIHLKITDAHQPLDIHAQRFVFTAGKGNAQLLESLGLDSPAMQLRPLQQVMVKHNYPFDFYGHCLGAESTPRLTISSHRLPLGEHIWYLGGGLAEKGANMPADELIAFAKEELAELIPWINLGNAQWATLPIERAEPRQPGLVRPDNAFITKVEGANNLLLGWPTKLTLAPNLANQALELLKQDDIQPSDTASSNLSPYLNQASLAQTPWDLAFPPAISAEERLGKMFYEDDEDNA
jgi:glycerol-3-phosphate dehydrogenase